MTATQTSPAVPSTILNLNPASTPLSGNEYVAIVQNGNTLRVPVSSLINNNGGSVPVSSSIVPTGGNGIYLPSANTVGIAANSKLSASFANPNNAVDNWAFSGAATATPSYISASAVGTDAKIGMQVNTKGTTTSGNQFYGTTDTSGKFFIRINSVNALEVTDTWWNPNTSYQGEPTAWPVISSGALAGGPDNIAVIGCNSSIYPGTATGVTLMYCARGSTGNHHFTNNGVVAHVNIAAVSNPNGNDTYSTANGLWLNGSAAGSGLDCYIFTNYSGNIADTGIGMTFYNEGTGNFTFLSGNTGTLGFKIFGNTASAVNALYTKPAITGGIPLLGAGWNGPSTGSDTNCALGLTAAGTGNVIIYNGGGLTTLGTFTTTGLNNTAIGVTTRSTSFFSTTSSGSTSTQQTEAFTNQIVNVSKTNATAKYGYGLQTYDSFYYTPGTAVNSKTAVTPGTFFGRSYWNGADGTNWQSAVVMIGGSDANGTISAGVVPGYWGVYTANSSGALTQGIALDMAQNFILGTAALATNATGGFLWVTSCPGAATGTLSAPYSNAAAVVYDSTDHKIYVNCGGTWRATAALT